MVTVGDMNNSAIHTKYMATNWQGAAKPDLLAIVKEIRAENPNIGGNGAMQRAVEVVRAWAVANGHAE